MQYSDITQNLWNQCSISASSVDGKEEFCCYRSLKLHAPLLCSKLRGENISFTGVGVQSFGSPQLH